MRSTKLKHFIEPYNAPYKIKHRYWTGLLLFVGIFLYLVFTFNVLSDPEVNLTVIILVMGGILFYKGNVSQIYRKKAIDVIEMVCYLNICSFSAIQVYVLQRKTSHQQSIHYAAYLSGTVIFILLVSIIVYHVYCVLHAWCLQKLALNTTDDEGSNQTRIVNAPNVMQSSSGWGCRSWQQTAVSKMNHHARCSNHIQVVGLSLMQT